jgi:hypothetical protein
MGAAARHTPIQARARGEGDGADDEVEAAPLRRDAVEHRLHVAPLLGVE